MPLPRPVTFFLTSLACLALLAGGTGCKRIQSKLDRLSKAAGLEAPEPPKPAEPPLTEEEKMLEKKVQETAVFETAKKEDEAPKAEPFELNKSSVVAILGYHDFRERGGTPMIIAASKFREQMQNIKDSGIPVIPFEDVMAWRRGEKNIPEEAIVITMDDGWEGVYTLAYPILKEYGFPFTIYLYKKYVNIGGRSLSWSQVREMMQNGCTVGSHSVSHESLRAKKNRNEADQQTWLLSELRDSKEFLEKELKVPCTSFAYPFGNFDDSTMELALQVGYDNCVTVNGQKVTWDTPLGKLGRYIIHGESDTNFKLATSFRGRGDVTSSHFLLADAKDDQGRPLLEFSPKPDELIQERRPLIEVKLQRVGTVVPDSVKMRVGGLGTVPAVYDPQKMTLSYQIPHRLRRDDCTITVTFKRDANQPEEVVSWRFKVDLKASYMPQS